MPGEAAPALSIPTRLTKYNPVQSDEKKAIIADAMARIENETLDQIAESHGISQPTLWKWLSITEGYDEQRRAMVDDDLATAAFNLQECEKELALAHDQLSLARVKVLVDLRDKLLRKAQWYAQVRDRRYAAKQEAIVTTVHTESLPGRAGELLELIERGLRDKAMVTVDHSEEKP